MTTTTPNSTALARHPAQSTALASVTGTSNDPTRITAMLQRAAEVAHVITPASSCPELPEGISVATSAVLVHPSEIYEIPGGNKVGLGKSALDRIGMALGVSWDPRESRRLDDGRTKHYVMFQAVGTYPLWDGSRAVCQGVKEIDLRDGSPAAQSMSPKQLAGARLHILAMAESKAKNRAIRSLGIRTAYSRDEVQRPFVCARAVFTGASNDPELARQFAVMRAEAMLGASRSLYGGAGPAPQLPPGRPAPAVGQVVDHDEDGVVDAAFDDEPEPSATSSSATSSERPRTLPPSDAVMRFGRARGTRLANADDGDLEWYRGALQRSVDDPSKIRWREDNQRALDEVLSEIRRRDGTGKEASGGGDDFDGPPPADDDIPFATSAMHRNVHPRLPRWER